MKPQQHLFIQKETNGKAINTSAVMSEISKSSNEHKIDEMMKDTFDSKGN